MDRDPATLKVDGSSDGGYPGKRRLYDRNYATLFGVEFALFGVYYTLLPVIPLYIVKLGGTESMVGLIMGLTAPIAALGTPVYGAAIDRWSRKGAAAVGFLLIAIGVVLLPLIAKPWLLLIPDLFRRAGTAATGAATRTILIDVAPWTRRGEAISTITISHNFATALGPLVGLALFDRSGIGPVAALCVVLAAFGMIGIIPMRGSQRSGVPATPGPEDEVVEHAGPIAVPVIRESIIRNVVTPEAWMPAVVLFLFVTAFFGTLAFVSLLGERREIPGFGVFFTVYGFVVIGSRLFIGQLSDRYGRGAVLAPCLVLGIVSMVLLGTANNLAMLLAAAVILGIGWGSAFPTLLTLAADRSSPDRVGRTMAMMSAAFAFGTAVGAILVGSFADAFGFGLAYGMIAGLLVIALAVLLGDYRRTGRPLIARVETVG